MEHYGLVLSGGGGKGAYQLGVYEALAEKGYLNSITSISGASIGAINLVLIANDSVETAVQVWSDITPLTIFDTDWELLDLKEGTFSREEMLFLMKEYINLPRVSQCSKRLHVSVSRKTSTATYENEDVLINAMSPEDITDYILASSSLPIIHEEVLIHGIPYRDGGLTDNFPIEPVYQDGCRTIITVGLKEEMKELEQKYPDVRFLSIYPSVPLGDLFSGTLNFSQKDIQTRRKLGYRDTLRQIAIFETNDASLLRKEPELAKLDYQQILAEQKQETLQSNISYHQDKLRDIMNKYDI